MGVDVSLNFMPAFYTKHAGLRYGEAYYFDPSHRAEVDRTESRFLYDVLGSHGVGAADPVPGADFFLQPVDLVMRTQGAEWRFPVDGTVESWGTPWAGLRPDEVRRVDAEAAAAHPVMDRVIAQYRTLKRLYGDRADLFGVSTGTMNVHTPYTTAHQLCGEGLLVMMMEDPAGAGVILAKVWEIYRAIYRRVIAATGARIRRVQLGDCAASMLSEATYREVVLPMNTEIASSFASAGYHSCGPSTHLLPVFAGLPGMDSIQLGPGTDLGKAARLMPSTHLQPLVDPVVMRGGSRAAVESYVAGLLDAAPVSTLCAWSFDRDTPIANVEAMYEVVEGRAAR